MTQTAPRIGADIRPVTRTARGPALIALAAAAVLFALVMLGLLPFTYAAPVIGVVLALGSPRSALLLFSPVSSSSDGGRVSASWVRLACTASYPAVVIFPSSVQFVEFAA